MTIGNGRIGVTFRTNRAALAGGAERHPVRRPFDTSDRRTFDRV